MWNSYFFQLQKKYNMRISTKTPLVIRFDGRQITKNKDINLLDNYKGSFLDSLEKTAKYFSERYHCFSIFGSDEISFIISDPNLVILDLEPSDKTTHSQEIIALFSQYFFDYFNHFDTQKKIFWHGKCFSIPIGKVNSYIKYRSTVIKNVMVTYFSIRNNINESDIGLMEKLKQCRTMPNYYQLENLENGILYYDGKKIDVKEFIKNNNIIEAYSEDSSLELEVLDIDDIEIDLI